MGTHPIFESDFDCLTENESHLAIRKKSVSIRELADFARTRTTESPNKTAPDGTTSEASSGISIQDKIRLEAIHQAALGDDSTKKRIVEKTFETFGVKKNVRDNNFTTRSSPQLGK